MGVLLAFAVGYAVGARAGAQGYEEIVQSLKEIRDSEEFRSMLRALRSHAAHALKQAAEMVGDEQRPPALDDLVARVRALANQVDPRTRPAAGGPTSTSS